MLLRDPQARQHVRSTFETEGRMVRHLLLTLALLAPMGATAQQPATPVSADEAAISAIVHDMESAWNKHDAKAYAAVFHRDAAFITFQGAYLKGRQDVEAVIARAHATGFRNSVTARRVEDVTFIGPDAAVVHVFRTNSGIADKPIPSRNTLVVTRRDGKWGVLAFQNTRLIDPVVK